MAENFPDSSYQTLRNLEMIDAVDQTKRRHILPSFLSKIASLDTNSLAAQVEENYLLKSLDQDYSEQQLRRGIRTLNEIAHFVRCVPQTKSDK